MSDFDQRFEAWYFAWWAQRINKPIPEEARAMLRGKPHYAFAKLMFAVDELWRPPMTKLMDWLASLLNKREK